MLEVYDQTIAGDTSTSLIAYTDSVINGGLAMLRYLQSTAPLSTAASVTITAAESGAAILTLTPSTSTGSLFYAPRMSLCNTTGATLSTGVFDVVPLASERIKIVVASGASSTGTATAADFYFYIQR